MKKEEESVPPPAVDPRLCCAAQICCDNPDDAKNALADLLRTEAVDKDGDTILRYDLHREAVAGWILDNFDLVPKGTATQLYKSLRPWFVQAERKKENGKG